MKVLVAENDEKIARSIAQALRARGDDVDLSGDGDEAERLAKGSAYEVIVLDSGLPRRNGFQVARDLRRAGQTVPILMLTSQDSAADAVRGLDSGADDYLAKPFRFDDLLARIGLMERPRGRERRRGRGCDDVGAPDRRLQRRRSLTPMASGPASATVVRAGQPSPTEQDKP